MSSFCLYNCYDLLFVPIRCHLYIRRNGMLVTIWNGQQSRINKPFLPLYKFRVNVSLSCPLFAFGNELPYITQTRS